MVQEKMLYCPKCQQTYEEGSQRFCNNDGGRLLPVSNAEKGAAKQGGVFTNLLTRNLLNAERDEKLASIPRFTRIEPEPPPVSIEPAPEKNVFYSDPDEIELELDAPPPRIKEIVPEPPLPELLSQEPAKIDESVVESYLDAADHEWKGAISTEGDGPVVADTAMPLSLPVTLDPILEENESPFLRPISRIVRPQDIPSGRAELGDRQVNPAGREALTWDNTDVMLGQTVKGRYHIVDRLSEDESGVSYLAEDKLAPDKMVLVRVLMDDEETDEFTNKIYAEERISFSHINHPNVVSIIDSGELQEGRPFVITEYIEGQSIKDILETSGQFTVSRTARVIRQAAYALSEMHQNGILHRNLKPGNIILTDSADGHEQVKITGFCVSDATFAEKDLPYKAPEVLGGQIATYASDEFSLAVTAYEMLTHRVPFSGSNPKQIVKSQREGMMLNPTNLRLDVPAVTDSILEKAMSVNAVDRYPKVRDFGDAFFNALTTVSPWDGIGEKKDEIELVPVADEESDEIPMPPIPLILDTPDQVQTETEPAAAVAETKMGVTETTPVTDDPAWTRRSPEPPKSLRPNWIVLGVFGVILVGGLVAIWIWAYNRPALPAYVAPSGNQNAPDGPPINAAPTNENLPATQAGEVPPPARQITQPPNTAFFQNSKENLKGDLARNFVPFTLYYPNDWKVIQAQEGTGPGNRGKFLDISRNAANGKLAEQMLISYYESRGTIELDSAKFPQFVAETNKTIKTLIPNYQMLSEGKTTINGGWWAYEVRFQGGGTTDTGEKLMVWGRRLFIPAARPGVSNGFEITMLATSYSDEVKSVDDVGTKGGLSSVLHTFEPGRNF